jgi:hypothetical protein
MRRTWIIGLCTTLLVGVAGAAEKTEDSWKTYRNEAFGYELSYPAEMEYAVYADGASGELKDTARGAGWSSSRYGHPASVHGNRQP